MWIQQLNGEHSDVTNAISSECQRLSESTECPDLDRHPAAVRQRVITDLRQRIYAATPPRPAASLELDMAEVDQCEDVRRLAELLKLRLASVSPRIDDTRVDKSSGLVTVTEASNVGKQVSVPMYRQDSHGRFVVSHYIHVTAHGR